MNGPHQFIRCCNDNGTGDEHRDILLPSFPDVRKGAGLFFVHVNEERLLGAIGELCPFVESIACNQAPSELKSGSIGWLFCYVRLIDGRRGQSRVENGQETS